MEIEQIKVGYMDVFAYLLWCPRTKEALVIDPGGDEALILERIKEKRLTLKYIVNTHGHGDHTQGNMKLKAFTGAAIIMHGEDDKMFNSPMGQEMSRPFGFTPSPDADILVKEGDEIVIGDVSLKVIHTPGHSPGGICLYGEGQLFTGDTLFVGGVGRTDLPGASPSQFMQSIKDKLLTLPGETIVWPGHDYGVAPSSTIKDERENNPWLK